MDTTSMGPDICAIRLERDEQRLAELETQITEVFRTLGEVDEKIYELQRTKADAQAWLSSLIPQRDEMLLNITSQRSARSPLSSLPEDVLGHIFRIAAFSKDSFWPSARQGTYNRDRARAPFIVASVSQHWRRAALLAPDIWHYVGIPAIGAVDYGTDPKVRDYVSTVLMRSGAFPLDIMLDSIDDHSNHLVTSIQEALNEHIHRWRRVYVAFSDTNGILDMMQFLRGRAPLLEEVGVVVTRYDAAGNDVALPHLSWPSKLPKYLSHCPRLRECYIYGIPFTWHPTHARLTSLVALTLEVTTMPISVLWSTLQLTPILEYLSITSGLADDENLTRTALSLTKLDTLRLHKNSHSIFERFPAALHLPSLRCVCVDPGPERRAAMPLLTTFFENCGNLLDDVELCNMVLTDNDVSILRPLSAVRTLSLDRCTVFSTVFDSMHDSTNVLMPRLSRMVLHSTSNAMEDDTDGLLRLVRARNPERDCPGCTEEDRLPWSSFEVLDIFDDCDFPKWDLIEIRGIMMDARLSTPFMSGHR